MHLVIYVHSTHESKRYKLPVGGISNAIMELLPIYESNPNIDVSLITKHSEYQPTSKKTSIYIIKKFTISPLNTGYFFILSFFLSSSIEFCIIGSFSCACFLRSSLRRRSDFFMAIVFFS